MKLLLCFFVTSCKSPHESAHETIVQNAPIASRENFRKPV